MTRTLKSALPLAVFVLVAAGCQTFGNGTEPQDFTMSEPDLAMAWVVTAQQEEACTGGASEMAGGEIEGEATFGELGVLDVTMSAAWDIAAANPEPTDAEYEPDGPAGGPFTTVLGEGAYPVQFQTNPFTQTCDPTVSATGELELTAADGDQIFGVVTGGETHRLDFAQQGDGIETFAEIAFDGGTGAFADASGSFVVHVIVQFDFGQGQFVVNSAEVLSGGTIEY